MSRLRKKESNGGGDASWLATMADLMQLLLTFFILLFSMSNVDDEKFSNVTTGIQEAFVGTGAGTSIIEGYPGSNIANDGQVMTEIAPEIVEMYDKVGQFITDNELQEEVQVTIDSEGVYVNIEEAILFDTGNANLKVSGVNVLGDLQPLINEFDNDIIVEGHTDNIPINSPKFPTNWELSTARAVAVVRYLSENENIDPSRLSARGYGEYSPIAPNDTPENRALNRRVNLFILFDGESEEQ